MVAMSSLVMLDLTAPVQHVYPILGQTHSLPHFGGLANGWLQTTMLYYMAYCLLCSNTWEIKIIFQSATFKVFRDIKMLYLN